MTVLNSHSLTYRAERAGSLFFSRDTMRFFNSRLLHSTVTRVGPNDFFFVTSERMDHITPRLYTVRRATFVANEDGSERMTVESGFGMSRTRAGAVTNMARAIKAVNAASA